MQFFTASFRLKNETFFSAFCTFYNFEIAFSVWFVQLSSDFEMKNCFAIASAFQYCSINFFAFHPFRGWWIKMSLQKTETARVKQMRSIFFAVVKLFSAMEKFKSCVIIEDYVVGGLRRFLLMVSIRNKKDDMVLFFCFWEIQVNFLNSTSCVKLGMISNILKSSKKLDLIWIYVD